MNRIGNDDPKGSAMLIHMQTLANLFVTKASCLPSTKEQQKAYGKPAQPADSPAYQKQIKSCRGHAMHEMHALCSHPSSCRVKCGHRCLVRCSRIDAVFAGMLRQLVAGPGCTDDAGPSTSGNPLAGLFSQLLGNSKQNELPEVRLPIPTFSKVDREKIRNRSHVHTRHLFPGVSQYLPFSLLLLLPKAPLLFTCSTRPINQVICAACRCTARGAGATAADIPAVFEHHRPCLHS